MKTQIPTLFTAVTVVAGLLASGGCNLQPREDGLSPSPTTEDRLAPLLDEARGLESALDDELSRANEVRDDTSALANAFVKVPQEIETRKLNFKAIRSVLDQCWNRADPEGKCEPAARSLATARKTRSKNAATQSFVDDKIVQLDALRPALQEEMPSAANALTEAAAELRERLDDLRGRFDAELARDEQSPDESGELDDRIRQMQELVGRIESRIEQADVLATQIRDTIEPLRVSVQEAINEHFFAGKRR